MEDKMKELFARLITNIDDNVLDVGKSQCELDSQLDQLLKTLDSIDIDEKLTTDIAESAKRISTLKTRLTVIHTILSDASARCSRTLAACRETTMRS
jgi:16S rRNA A1518/A1519 N6-dimethyltransferase RsmA/KsgA/DIM1 with predicted DNA glycosylase/AP lyase activity